MAAATGMVVWPDTVWPVVVWPNSVISAVPVTTGE